jgi:hypothetical protein
LSRPFSPDERSWSSLARRGIKPAFLSSEGLFEESKLTDAPDDSNSIDSRRAARVRTFLQARISYGDGAISTACTVNQLSEVGARINIAGAFSLPETFEIVIPQRGISRRVKLVWRKDDLAGVDFVDAEEREQSAATTDPTARIKALEAENAKLKAQIGVLTQQIQRLTDD